MNIAAIPPTFWYSVSFSIVTLTLGFLYISWKHGDFNIKVSELEFRSQNISVLEKKLEEMKANAEKGQKEIERLHGVVKAQADKFKGMDQLFKGPEVFMVPNTTLPKIKIDPSELISFNTEELFLDDDFEQIYQDTEKNLSLLKDKQDQIQQSYLSHKTLLDSPIL